MFTGIVQGTGVVSAIGRRPGLYALRLDVPAGFTRDLKTGASVAVDGVCLTVTAFDDATIGFDVMQQTLTTTTLGELSVGRRVNIERSARYGDEVGGHVVSGHIDAAVSIARIERSDDNREITYRLDDALRPYVFARGFIALNGCSLTVAEVDATAGSFKVCFIPETLRATTHGEKQVGDSVNLELDRQTQAVVETVRSYLNANAGELGLRS